MTPVEKYLNPLPSEVPDRVTGAAYTLGIKEITFKVNTLRVANKVWLKVVYLNETR